MVETEISQSPSSSQRDVETSVSEHLNPEGTLHQSKEGKKPIRKHFFSPLDVSYADAVHRDAATVVFTEAEEVCLYRTHIIVLFLDLF